ncbi:Signal transduction histidine kinase [Nakamurella panacisegetis]|uniref:Signal transduction histidine-protein kinase/phosphatase MprB n=1 Tax=Nakamurella panacisegetis TaxID=1090615 RepID=A0A1H0PGH4_9ACTN|nr:ATP-binding protein [Nakamurella panacisegetis]SDP03716.1 Signal transduction histidine kinase [Nakamurella panacisegetis]
MRRRILTSILLVIAAIVVTLALPLGVVSWRLVDDLKHQELAGRLQSMETSISLQSERASAIDLSRLEVAIPEDGRLVIRQPGKPDRAVGAPASSDSYSESVALPGGGQLILSVPMGNLRAERWRAVLLVAAAVVLSLLVATAIALILARRLSTPLSDVARRAARLGSGDFRTFRRRYGIAELDRVADVLDSSATDIAALLSRERDLAGDISHQLRTRLTGLRLRLEEIALNPDPAVVAEVHAALDQTDRLVTVVDDLLANARSQRAAGSTELDLSAELEDLATDFRPRAAAAGRTFRVKCPKDISVRATAVRLREALGALLDNALVHGAGAIRVTVRPDAASVVIEVSDEGNGVPTPLVGHIFERGMSTASSTGLGLGLARALIEADGGRLELRRASPPVFGIFLTAENAADESPVPVVPNAPAPPRTAR